MRDPERDPIDFRPIPTRDLCTACNGEHYTRSEAVRDARAMATRLSSLANTSLLALRQIVSPLPRPEAPAE